jgi:hypothetical protein
MENAEAVLRTAVVRVGLLRGVANGYIIGWQKGSLCPSMPIN